MKFVIISPDKNHRIDGVVFKIISGLPIIENYAEADAVLIPITKLENYEFNEDLNKIEKPVVVFDYCEYGWEWDRKETHIFGTNTGTPYFDHPLYNWMRFHFFLKNVNQPLIYFKRELLKKDFKDTIYPIEYPSFHPPATAQTEEQFNERPLKIFNCFGHSHECRRVLHGTIFSLAHKFGYFVGDNFSSLENVIKYEQGDIWASIFVPYFARHPMDVVLNWNGKSKISISMEGAGAKCFRSTIESPHNSIMAMRQNGLAWAYEWNNENAIIIPTGNDLDSIKGLDQTATIEFLYQQSKRTDLYRTYLNSLYTAEKYYYKNYLNNYVLKTIADNL